MENSTQYKRGDIVKFIGTKHFKAPNSKVFFTIKPGIAKVSAVSPTGQHPYHLVAEPNSGSTVKGWVNEEDIAGLHKASKLKVVSFADSNDVKIAFGINIQNQLVIKAGSWVAANWVAVFRPKDVKVAESLANVAEIGCAKESFGNVQVYPTTFIEICGEAAKLPIAEDMSKTALVNSGMFYHFTSDEYLAQSDYLRRGDLLLSDKTSAVVLSNGKKSEQQARTANAIIPEEEENKTYVGKGIGAGVAKNESKVHSSAGESFAVVGIIKAGSPIEILNITADGWFKIVWTDSVEGFAYVQAKNFAYTPKAKSAEKKEIIEASDEPNAQNKQLIGRYRTIVPASLRNGAGTDQSILKQLPKGVPVRNYGYYTEEKGIKWLYCQASYKNTIFNGFISEKCLIKE